MMKIIQQLIFFLILGGLIFGCSKDKKKPKAKFTIEYPLHNLAPGEVTFNPNESSSEEGTITKFEWNFGDGKTLTVPYDPAKPESHLVKHFYDKPGTFVVNLTVFNDKDRKGSVSHDLILGDGRPNAKYSYSSSIGVAAAPTTLEFSAAKTVARFPEAKIIKYFWDFGDGSGVVETLIPSSTHFYPNPGDYEIQLTAEDDGGRKGTYKETITLGDGAPEADFTYSLSIPMAAAPVDISFDASSSHVVYPGAEMTNYLWDFGDGSPVQDIGLEKTISHHYANPGTYVVKLLAKDNAGRVGMITKKIILDPALPKSLFTLEGGYGGKVVVGKEVGFNGGASSAVYPGATLQRYNWNFGDNQVANDGTDPTIKHIYDKVGNYTVKLEVVDSLGKKGVSDKVIQVVDGKPVASFNFSLSSANAPSTVTFDAAASSDIDGNIVAYYWDFGSSQTSSVAVTSTTKSFNQAGTFPVSLKVIDNEGKESTKVIKNIVIKPPLPVEVNEAKNGSMPSNGWVHLDPFTAEKGSFKATLTINKTETETGVEGGGLSAWAEIDSPNLLRPDMNYYADQLPRSGESTRIPWAGNYWPTYRDSINYRWQGPNSNSPAKKYELAFGKSGIENLVSAEYGIDAQSSAKTCTADAQCNAGSEKCSIRNGQSAGRCVPTWFGICHAWAPAAIMEYEPVLPVTHNGVEFRPNDLKALVSYGYNSGLYTKFMSLRCNLDENQIVYDEYGRPTNPECKDSNAGSFHVVVTNILGIHKESLVEDRTFDDEVWNQPLRGYTIETFKAITATEANLLVNGSSTNSTNSANSANYLFNNQAVDFRHVKMKLHYITESAQETDNNLSAIIDRYTHVDAYEYVLELDGQGKIIGGEWVGNTKKNHPDFLWVPYSKVPDTVSGIAWKDVQMLLRKSSQVQKHTKADGGTVAQNYIKYFGPYVVSEETGIEVSLKSLTGDSDLVVRRGAEPRIDDLRNNDCYSAVEGTGIDQCNLPGAGEYYVGVVGYNAGANNFELKIGMYQPMEAQAVNEKGNINAGEFLTFGPYEDVSPNGPFQALLESPLGMNLDLYVKRGEAPTEQSYDCRPSINPAQDYLMVGKSKAESCYLDKGGSFYVGIKSYNNGTSTFNLDLYSLKTNDREPGTLGVLYIKKGKKPTEADYDCRYYLGDGGSQSCELTGPGSFYISLKSFETAIDYDLDVKFFKIPTL